MTTADELLNNLKLAYLEVISTSGARNPANFYHDVFREIWGIREREPKRYGELVIKYVEIDLPKWDSQIWVRDVQPTPTQQQEGIAMLFNLGRLKFAPNARRQITAEGILKLKNCKPVTWRSHDGGATGYEVDFIEPFCRFQLERKGLV